MPPNDTPLIITESQPCAWGSNVDFVLCGSCPASSLYKTICWPHQLYARPFVCGVKHYSLPVRTNVPKGIWAYS